MRQHSEAAWKIASLYSHVLASETRDLAAQIDMALEAERMKAREFVAGWMMERGYATGHGETIADLLIELEGEANDHGARGIPPRHSVRDNRT
jgi:hypothetical protein